MARRSEGAATVRPDGDIPQPRVSWRSTFTRLLGLFDGSERWRLGGLLLLLLATAVIETMGVASILPFMAIVSDPGVIESNRWLNAAYEGWGFESTRAFLLFTGLVVLAILVFSNLISAASTWMTLRFMWLKNHRLSVRLISGYLNEPYDFFLRENSSDLLGKILTEVAGVVQEMLTPAVRMIAKGMASVAIFVMLIVVDPRLAIIVALVLGSAYAVVFALLKRRLDRIGRARVLANSARYRAAGEAFGGIKEIKMVGAEAEFVGRFEGPSARFASYSASNQAISQLPRFALESIAFGGILLVMLYFLAVRGGSINEVIPVVSLYAFAGYKLMPALQEVFGGVTQIRFHVSALDQLYEDLRRTAVPQGDDVQAPAGPAFTSSVELIGVSFRYDGADDFALEDVSLEIRRNEVVALVGSTGSGKSTLVDLLLGLLPTQQGRILIDGSELQRDDLSRWRRSVGYVPQHIYLCDDTVERNIAFGVPRPDIDRDRVVKAAEMAAIHDFIDALPQGYETVTGERGVRLSGGQRQRIGIARALYRDTDILVLDEATSALDSVTEEAVMGAVLGLAESKTVILIAHRFSTVRQAQRIFLLEDGRIVADGTFSELTASNSTFRALAQALPARLPGWEP